MPLDKSGFFIQEDNVAVEFNIPPAKTQREFVTSIQWTLSHITKKLHEHKLKIKIIPSAHFPNPELRKPGSNVFGCDPDFNAWREGTMNPRPFCNNRNLR